MERFGFNINLKNTPEEIVRLGELYLATGLYQAIEVTYYEDMQDVDTHAYNAAVRRLTEAYRPQVTVHISGFNTSEENSVLRSAIVHEFANCCKYTHELGGHEIVLHCGRMGGALHVPLLGGNGGLPTSEQVYRRAWQLSVQLFRTCCDIAKQYGMTVYTENLNREHLTVRTSTLVDFVREVDRDNLFIVFDIGHCHHTQGDIPADVRACGSLLRHLHLHDNFGDGDSHLPIGEGNIDYRSFVAALREVGYTGLYMMELNHCDEKNLALSRERLLQCM